jgi:coenzyme F420-reducing hydrogenase delta subunit
MPFRSASALVPGIDLPHFSIAMLRDRVDDAGGELTGSARVFVFGCDYAADVRAFKETNTAAVSLPCIAMLPPAFIDYVLSRGLADGVFLTGCRDGECFHRLGVRWTEARLAGTRDPYLRARVPRERLATLWAAPTDHRRLGKAIQDFAHRLSTLAPMQTAAPKRAAGTGPKPAMAEMENRP